ncbi:MAG: hypothetical protein LUQ11_06485 [Methylococcaceae bacterium]|nr:hypothetical protein [Methylococcaceae bacterium]
MSEEYSDWELHTGRLIVSFGDIELLTYKLFDSWIKDKKARRYTLGDRLDKLIGCVESAPDQSGELVEIKTLLKDVKELNEIRNLVAHNPTILKNFDDINLKPLLTDLREEKEPLSLEQLHEHANKALSLKAKLFIKVSQYTKIGIDQLFS